jgi:hypothetical protein
VAQALDVWFIHLPQIVKLLLSRTILHCDTGLRQQSRKAVKLEGGRRSGAKTGCRDLAKIWAKSPTA